MSILTTSPKTKCLYKFDAINKDDQETVEDLGLLIKDMSKFTPGGVLVFFCSFGYMNSCLNIWNDLGVTKQLEEIKDIYKDLQDSVKNKEVLKTFTENNKTNKKGGILFSVLRGSASEGIDFSDDIARLVIIVGIPYPPLGDARVVLKKEYLNDMLNTKTSTMDNINFNVKSVHNVKSVKKLTSSDWYTQCAIRAVNQAIGRVIRHQMDYGTMLLIDCRYQEINSKGLFSYWLRPSIKVHNDINVLRELKAFFVNMDCKIFYIYSFLFLLCLGVIAERQKKLAKEQEEIKKRRANANLLAINSTSNINAINANNTKSKFALLSENNMTKENINSINFKPASSIGKVLNVNGTNINNDNDNDKNVSKQILNYVCNKENIQMKDRENIKESKTCSDPLNQTKSCDELTNKIENRLKCPICMNDAV